MVSGKTRTTSRGVTNSKNLKMISISKALPANSLIYNPNRL